MRSLRAAYNFAIKLDDEDELRANPVGGVHFHPERRREAIILPEDLPDWWRRSEELPNSLRTTMHRLGLLSGLRPGTLVSLQREWIDLGGRAIRIPRMKSGRAFDLPLSEPMVALVENALRIGDVLYRDPPWLFPTRANDGRGIIHTQVWKEKTMRGETGHVLRHTYRTMADRLGIPQSRARALLDHKQPGIEAHYLHSSALRDELLADQERMTAHILETAKAL
jgi:integrase